jgi:subtilisin family serine protease
MKALHTIIASIPVALILAGCSGSAPINLPPQNTIVEKMANATVHPTGGYYLGQVQVEVINDAKLSDVIANMKAKNQVDLSVIDKIPNEPVFLLEINSTNPVPDVVKMLKRDANVIAASKNRMISAGSLTVNDPMAISQWALSNSGQDAPGALAGRAGADIGMEGISAEGSYDVVVGVIDTGIDYFHEDLAITETIDGVKTILAGSNIWTNPGEIAGNGLNDDNNGDPRYGIQYIDDVHGYNFVSRTGDPMDDAGHGTHVSGVIGALRNNFKGISGINQKVSLMGLKFLGGDGSGSDFNAQMAIYYAIDMKKRFPDKKFILTNSWGASGRDTKDGDSDDLLLRAFRKATMADILVVAAAGNDGTSNRYAPHYPANYASKLSNFITVAATNNLDQLASFSSYGYDQVQIAAPGVLIMSTVPAALYLTPYQAWSGTSMATPHVTGAAALVWASNPGMKASDVKARLLNTVDVLPQLHGSVTTSGRLNLKRALAGDENKVDEKKTPAVLEQIPYVNESPRGEEPGRYDLMTEIKQADAKEIQVCFSRINLSKNDWIEIIGPDYRVRDTFNGEFDEETATGEIKPICTAPVLGEKLFIRLWKQGGSTEGLQGFQTKYLQVTK